MMALHRLAHWISLAFVVSVVGMMAGAARGSGAWLAGWAVFFLVVVGAVSAVMNRSHLSWPRDPDTMAVSVMENARLAAIAYAWCGTALQAVYITPVTGLRWQHSWQYGLALALMAVLTFAYAGLAGQRQTATRRNRALTSAPLLAFIQVVMAAGIAVFLIVSGKLMTRRMDWAANQVFLFGCLVVLVVVLMSLVTLRRIEQS